MTTSNDGDPFDLDRFVRAQEEDYEQALAEIRSGRKRSHWMWYVFPQVDGLGYSSTAKYYAIKSIEEARAYLEHPILGPRGTGTFSKSVYRAVNMRGQFAALQRRTFGAVKLSSHNRLQ